MLVMTTPGSTLTTRTPKRRTSWASASRARERPLRSGVGDLIGGGDEPGDRGDVHDRPPPALAHRRQHRPNAAYRAEVVGLEHAPVLVLGRQLERGGAADAGIVDEHVHGAVRRHRLEGAAGRW